MVRFAEKMMAVAAGAPPPSVPPPSRRSFPSLSDYTTKPTGDFIVWLEAEGVGVEHFTLVAGAPTALAFVTSDEAGEPAFDVHGDGIPAAMASVESRLEDAMANADALFFGSNTLVGESERELTMRARSLALDATVSDTPDASTTRPSASRRPSSSTRTSAWAAGARAPLRSRPRRPASPTRCWSSATAPRRRS